MLNYLLIGGGLVLLWKVLGGKADKSPNQTYMTDREDFRPEPPGEAPVPLIKRMSDAAERFKERSAIQLDDTRFDLSYCGWFREFRIIVDACLKQAKFKVEQQASFERDPGLKEIYDSITLKIESKQGKAAFAEKKAERESLLNDHSPVAPLNDDPVVGPRQLEIYERRLGEHMAYIASIKEEFRSVPALREEFHAALKGKPEEQFVLEAFRHHSA